MSWADELGDLWRSLTQQRSVDLKVWRDRRPDGVVACFTLNDETREVPYDTLVQRDLARLHRGDAAPELPAELAAWLSDVVGERDVWVTIGPPAGDLDLLAWPTLLGRVLEGTVRYPVSGLGRVADRRGVVALMASMARAKEVHGHYGRATAYVEALATSLRKGGREVHVFADLEQYRRLSDTLAGVHVHDPSKEGFDEPPRHALVSAGRQISNPWMAWVHAALLGRNVDVLHFVCHGYHDGQRGALALAQSPARNDDVHWARFVGDAEVGALVDQLGADSVVLTSPDSDYSRVGLRRLARELARWRGLTVALQGVRWDSQDQLKEAVTEALELHRSLTRVRIPEPPPRIELSAPKIRVDIERLSEGMEAAKVTASALTDRYLNRLASTRAQAGPSVPNRTSALRVMSLALRSTRLPVPDPPDPPAATRSPFGKAVELDWADDYGLADDDNGGAP